MLACPICFSYFLKVCSVSVLNLANASSCDVTPWMNRLSELSSFETESCRGREAAESLISGLLVSAIIREGSNLTVEVSTKKGYDACLPIDCSVAFII